jgi:toxin-antitoxin system PIN domain toxin
MTLSIFPDINVWLALSSPDHQHCKVAWSWYRQLSPDAALVFCRLTQMGLLRLLTTQAVMGAGTLTQAEAWEAYDRWSLEAEAEFAEEPTGLDAYFRARSGTSKASPKEWADAYLAAFAEAAGLQLATFDRALAAKAGGAILLA